METESNIVPLSEEEERVWNALVEKGRELRASKLAAKEAAIEAKAVVTDGHKHAKKPHSEWKTKKHLNMELSKLFDIPVPVKRFVVLRAAGLSFSKSVRGSGVKWCDVSIAKDRSEEARCAYAAMEEWSRDLMRTRSYGTVEDAVSGEPVSKVMANMSQWVLERVERDRFADPKARAPAGASAPGQVGGIAIYLVDTSKGRSPRPAEDIAIPEVEMKGVEA